MNLKLLGMQACRELKLWSKLHAYCYLLSSTSSCLFTPREKVWTTVSHEPKLGFLITGPEVAMLSHLKGEEIAVSSVRFIALTVVPSYINNEDLDDVCVHSCM